MGPRVRGDDDRVYEVSHHGIAKRSVLPPLLMSTAAKPVTVRPRLPQSLLVVDLELALAGAQLLWRRPSSAAGR